MGFETLRYAVEGPVATVTFDRPEKMNTFTAKVSDEFVVALKMAEADDAVRAVIITANGRVFCAGADMSEGGDSFDMGEGGKGALNFETTDGGRVDEKPSFTYTMFNMSKPTITAFNGSAVGVGATLALPTDFRISVDTAKFGFVFTRRGLLPEAASTWFLPKIVGLSQALRWCLSGRLFSAQEALKGGLVDELVPADQLLTRAREIALEIADNTAPVATALTRQLLWRAAGADLPFATQAFEAQFTIALGSTGDVKEGVGAFLEKRAPNFPLRVSDGMPDGYPFWDDSAEPTVRRRA